MSARALGRLAVVALGVAGAVWIGTHRGAADARAGAAGRSTGPAPSLPGVSGGAVDLASLRGRAVAVNFWATWCPPCRFEIPELAAFYRENRDRCLDMVGVAEESGGRDEVARAARSYGIPYPVLLDPDGGAAQRFGVSGLPHTVVLDATGKVRRVFEGPVTKEQLESAVDPLLPPRGTLCPHA